MICGVGDQHEKVPLQWGHVARSPGRKGHLNQPRKIRSLITPAVPAASQGPERAPLRHMKAEDPKQGSGA